LITGLWAAVSDRHSGPAVVESLRSRYALVMVDEFQDTDPVQWKIFDRAFHDRLITVGDPKQAIYRFRGADVQAYLSATDGASTVQLGTNWRSDADLVTATNSLIDGFEFGHERIVGVSVQPAPTARPSALASGQPFVLRRVPRHPSLFTAKGAFSTPLARRLIVRDLVATVVDLLTHHTIEGKHGVVPVQPGDIAVLVPSHSNANTVAGALARAGVPAVRTRTGSVLATPAAAEWAILLTALERPSYAPAARAAGLSVFLQLDAAHLDPLAVEADVTLGTLQQQLATWAELLVKRSFLAWYDHVRAESRLVANLLADPDGERRLTDLDHIAELLAAAIGAAGATAANARRTLDQLRSAAVTIEDAEDQMRRIDSDAQAVQVTTLHGSKGLEYPVVLLPLQWQVPKNQGPLVYNDHEANRVIDIATEQGWSGVDNKEKPASRKYYATTDARGDRLRLLYVALTRAQHRTVMWWAPGSDSSKSAANALLFDRNSTGAPNNTRPALTFGPRGGPQEFDAAIANPSDTDAAERLQVLATSSDGLIDVSECPASVPFARWLPDLHGDVPPQLSVAPTNGRRLADFMWRHWSFTAITKTLLQEWSPYTSSAPVVGGSDESEAADDPTQVPAASSSTNTSTMPLADVVAGAEFGTLVHSVLERIDPASSTLRDNLRDAVRVQTHRDGVKVDVEVLTDGLFAAIDTPLGTIADGLRLADIPASDRLAELDFDMPLASAHPRATAAQIGQVLLATLDPDDPQRAYAQELVDSRFTVDLAGFMHGSIDAVLRIPDTTCGHRYVVVDYKTNRLHQKGAARPLDAYHPSLLPAAMAHSDYPLQALLYSVATHRYLRWRLGASYSPAQHLGGVAYLFVRGMVGTATPTTDGHPHGVFAWRPPAATIEALDRLLSSGVVA
ncbi:MAG: UvrD-helicase domain-containing protein, partial [Actinomycetota bacterium]